MVYTPTEHFAEMEHVLKESKLFEMMVEELNQTLALPVDVRINFTECGEPNAFYDPQSHQLSMCYELIEDAAQRFSELDLDEEELDQAVISVAVYVFLHELGHALADVLDLPITGKEEDAVDQLAIASLLDSGEEGAEVALDAAAWFLTRLQDTDSIRQWPFWDQHSLDIQRFYNILCWVYGKDPIKNAELVHEECSPGDGGCLPQERAEGCQSEYQQLSKNWDKLLAPHLKKK